MAVHANSLANLTTPFAGHGDPRNGHSRSMGASTIEWMNRLDIVSTAELERIRDAEVSRDNPHSKAIAAAAILRARTDGFAKNGAPFAANDVDRLLDRTVGKATQRVEVQQQQIADPAALKLELARLIAEHPEALASMGLVIADNAVPALPDASGADDPPGAPNPGSDAVE